MRKLDNTNFETSNIEYIQFWMMDPFSVEGDTNEGGDLYFNLGEVSEDILKDGYKSYETDCLPTAVLAALVRLYGDVCRLKHR